MIIISIIEITIISPKHSKKTTKGQLIYWIQVFDCDVFKKPELDIECPAGPTMLGQGEKLCFLHHLYRWENAFPKARKLFCNE